MSKPYPTLIYRKLVPRPFWAYSTDERPIFSEGENMGQVAVGVAAVQVWNRNAGEEVRDAAKCERRRPEYTILVAG